ncbi:hypothetical protein FRB99_007961 [Tulasnella sp. 403]|nr:hypothetical protein FRB99_007961 [Tulasnella sp. 403]
MSSTTPLMAEYPAEKVLVVNEYPIDESDEELVVGAPQRRCFWARFRGRKCAHSCGEKKQRSPLRRAIRWLLTFILIAGVAGFLFCKYKTHVIHSNDVEDGHVEITFDLPKDAQLTDEAGDAELYSCHIAGPRFVALGVHAKDKHGERPKAVSTTVKLPASEAGKARPISLHGDRRFGRPHGGPHGCMKKRIRQAIMASVRAAKLSKAAEEHPETA